MFAAPITRRTVAATALVGAPIMAAGLWMANGAAAQPAPVSASTVTAAAKTTLRTDRSIMILAPNTKSGARRILTVHHKTYIVDFARKKTDKKYSLLSGGEVWMALNPVGPAKDSNYQIVTARDSEGGDVDCLSMNSAGQISEESCEEVEKPGELIIGRDVFHFEKRGKKWDIQAFRGYLEAHGRQAGRTKDWNTRTAKGLTVVYAPVG